MECDVDLGAIIFLFEGEQYPCYSPLSNVMSMIGVEVEEQADSKNSRKSK